MNQRVDIIAADIRHIGITLENAALLFVSRAAPWLGPLPTAWLVYNRTMRHLSWPSWVAIVAAISLEFLGIATSVTALQLWIYRHEKLRSEPDAPILLPVLLTSCYFIAAELLTVVLDLATLPKSEVRAAHFAPALFPVLSLVSVILLAIRQANADAFLSAAERKAKRKGAKVEQTVERLRKRDFEAYCPSCGWRQDGYKTSRAAINAKNAHKCKEIICWCSERFKHPEHFEAHEEIHGNEARAAESLPDALAMFERLYPSANGGPSTEQVIEWRK